MRRATLAVAAIGVGAMIAISAFTPSNLFIWNRTQSAPKGLYWCSDGPLDYDGWAVVSGVAPASIWIANNGYLAPDWPIIKRVRGLPGDEICRYKLTIAINGKLVATALISDGAGRELPVWEGCVVLSEREVFLLNDHPRSLDGRYFGATDMDDVTGSARLLIKRD